MSAPVSMIPSRPTPSPQPSVLILGARALLRWRLSRLERRIFPVRFDANLSAQIDQVCAALEVLR